MLGKPPRNQALFVFIWRPLVAVFFGAVVNNLWIICRLCTDVNCSFPANFRLHTTRTALGYATYGAETFQRRRGHERTARYPAESCATCSRTGHDSRSRCSRTHPG